MEKVLIIEDERALREDILKILHFEGFEARGAENGMIGIQLARQFQPDLIICDIMMPLLDGYGVLQELKQDPLIDSIPLLFMTAKTEKEDIRFGMNLGAEDYLTKPVKRQDLLQAIKTRLERRASVAHRYESQIETINQAITRTLPHELRTPLGIIMGWLDYALSSFDTLTPEDLYEAISKSYKGSLRLRRLIENHLTYAQLAYSKVDPSFLEMIYQSLDDNPNYPAEYTERLAQEIAARWNRENDLYLELENVGVRMSLKDFAKIAEEIIDNAFKFSSKGDRVLVQLHSVEQTCQFLVADHGRGMLPEQIKAIGPLKQFGREAYEQQGMGLGLIIAKYLVELYGGNLVINSEPHHLTEVQVLIPSINHSSL